jgi:hypothetical protein
MNTLKAAIWVLCTFILGFVRDFVFVQVNNQLYFASRAKFNEYLHPSLSFLHEASYLQLYVAKYWLTLVFFQLFLVCNLLAVRAIFKKTEYLYLTFFISLALFVVSLLVLFGGSVVGLSQQAYTLSRFIAGWFQSPLLIFILIPAFYMFPLAYKQK